MHGLNLAYLREIGRETKALTLQPIAAHRAYLREIGRETKAYAVLNSRDREPTSGKSAGKPRPIIMAAIAIR